MQLCLDLGLHNAALANEGFVMVSPDSRALLTALRQIHATSLPQETATQWTFVSNRAGTIETLRPVGASVGATGRLAETAVGGHSGYHGFFPPA
jgi:hypothetical protein